MFENPEERGKWAEKTRTRLVRKKTRSEMAVKKALGELGIEFDFQRRFDVDERLYFADFYIPAYHTVLEIDGGHHRLAANKKKDKAREKAIGSLPFVGRVVRMGNEDALSGNLKILLVKLLFPEAWRYLR